jgi:hypothetical protein
MKLLTTVMAMFLALLLTACLNTQAQFKQIAEGPKFAEPEEGFAKILQMKNGNTVYFHITKKDGINLRTYDANHIEKIATNITTSFERLKEERQGEVFIPTAKAENKETIEGLFEMNNDLVIFISESSKKNSILYRLIIDVNAGKLKEEIPLFTLQRFGRFQVRKDASSENYAILVAGTFDTENDYQKRIIHFGANNKEINRGNCELRQKEAGLYLDFKDMIVLGPDRICTFFFYGNEKKGGSMYLRTLEKGDTTVSFTKLDMPGGLIYEEGTAKYNPIEKKIVFLAITKSTDKRAEYGTLINTIDPVTKIAANISSFEPSEKLNEEYNEKFNKKDGYNALPQNLFINEDGSFSVVYEEMLVQYQESGRTTRKDTKLGKMVVTTIDKNGKLVSNYLVPKAHWVLFTDVDLFYHAKQKGHARSLYVGNQYKSFIYLNSIKGNYILFNDTERNNEVKKDKFVEIQAIKDCEAFMYKLTGSDIFPKREYTFGVPAAKEHHLVLYSVSDYDRKNNVFITLDKNPGSDKEVKLVWLQPQ